MIDIWKATRENRLEALALLQAYKDEFGENDEGFLFSFSKKNAPWILLDAGSRTGDMLIDVRVSSVNLNDGGNIEIYVKESANNDIICDYWYYTSDCCGLTENNVYEAIVNQLYDNNYDWMDATVERLYEEGKIQKR